MRRLAPAIAIALFIGLLPLWAACWSDQIVPGPDTTRVLVFSKTAGFRHGSIEAGVLAIDKLGDIHDFSVAHTEHASFFDDDFLSHFDVVVFLSTTGDVLDGEQQAAFKRFVQGGGGYVGVHSAADTEYDWPWYGELMGAYFAGHPAIQEADVIVLNSSHPSTSHLTSIWQRRDEWYRYRAVPAEDVTVLMTLDETSFNGGGMDGNHPIAWCHEFDGGRAWYTGGGHTKESFEEQAFLEHLLGGIQWAAGAGEVDQ